MTDIRTRPCRALRLAGLAAAAAVLAIGTSAGASYAREGLEQRIDRDQALADGQVVLEQGHVDVGPRLIDDEWTLLVHDDAAKDNPTVESSWRRTEDVVLRVSDAAVLEVPEDPAYSFLGVPPGSPVHVVPQTQNQDVVWVGWNTQDPEVMELVDRGVTLELEAVQGPGHLLVYLQSGSFGDPDVLWDSRAAEEQPVWVDVNTHTHANWVFTKPGVYLVELSVSADTIDGRTMSDTRVLRFAIGDGTDPQEAFAAALDRDVPGPPPAAGDASTTPTPGTATAPGTTGGSGNTESADGARTSDAGTAPAADGGDSGSGLLIAVLISGAVVLAVVTTAVVRRGQQAKRRAMAQGGN
jgi:putative ABC transporter-associated repeat protein